jgi:hypothetical protein
MLDSSIPVPTTNASDKCAGTNRTDTAASGLKLQCRTDLSTMPRFFLLGWFSAYILLASLIRTTSLLYSRRNEYSKLLEDSNNIKLELILFQFPSRI